MGRFSAALANPLPSPHASEKAQNQAIPCQKGIQPYLWPHTHK